MTGVQTCALPICFPVTISGCVENGVSTDSLNTVNNTVFSLVESTTSVTISPDASSFSFVCNFSAPVLSGLIKLGKVSFAVFHLGTMLFTVFMILLLFL